MGTRRSLIRKIGGLTIAGSIGSLAGCIGSSSSGGQGGQGDSILFGGSVSLSGGLSSEGQYTAKGYRLWRDYVNKKYGGIRVGNNDIRPVKLKLYDDKTDTETAVKLYQKLVTQDNVDFLLGPYSSGLTLAVAPIAEKYQIPMVEANGASDKIFKQGYKYIYGVLSPASKYHAQSVEFATKLKNPNVAKAGIVHVDTLFTNTIADGASKKLEEAGIKEVFNISYAEGTNDLSNVINTIKQHDIELLLNAGHLPDEILLAKQASSRNVEVPLVVFSGSPLSSDFQQNLGKKARGTATTAQWLPQLDMKGPIFGTAQNWTKQWNQKYDASPYYVPAESSAGGVAFQLAIENIGSTKPKQVKKALDDMNEMSFFGRLKFADGKMHGANLAKPMVTAQLQKNLKTVAVSPDQYAQGEINYPAGTW
jgi:branched-chain amino acid transport system substrate-binding protein